MRNLVSAFLLTLLLFYATWMFYVVVMALKKRRDDGTLTRPLRVLGYPVLLVGLVLDFLTNVAATVVFVEVPRELLLTSRLTRYKRTEPEGWRNRFGQWLCTHLLNPFDPSGHHC